MSSTPRIDDHRELASQQRREQGRRHPSADLQLVHERKLESHFPLDGCHVAWSPPVSCEMGRRVERGRHTVCPGSTDQDQPARLAQRLSKALQQRTLHVQAIERQRSATAAQQLQTYLGARIQVDDPHSDSLLRITGTQLDRSTGFGISRIGANHVAQLCRHEVPHRRRNAHDFQIVHAHSEANGDGICETDRV